MKNQIYVIRSQDEQTTKIGRTRYLNCRLDSLIASEKQKYYLVYNSEDLPEQEAKEIELKIIEKFKEDVIKGKEWFSTHPLKIIKYITSLIGYAKSSDLSGIQYNRNYPAWTESLSKFNKCEYVQDNGVGIKSRAFTAHVRILYKGKRWAFGFANIGDANNFACRYKYNIEAVEITPKLLYGLTYKEWVRKNYEDDERKDHIKWLMV